MTTSKITEAMKGEAQLLEIEHAGLIKEISAVLGPEDELTTQLRRWHDDFSLLVDSLHGEKVF